MEQMPLPERTSKLIGSSASLSPDLISQRRDPHHARTSEQLGAYVPSKRSIATWYESLDSGRLAPHP